MPRKLAALVLAVAASTDATGGEGSAAAWTVSVNTSGGFVGRGRGNVVVDSNGKVVAGGCEGKLSEAEKQRIAAAVAGSKPSGWASGGMKGAAPDAFGYVLELRRGQETQRAAWYDNTRNKLPADLAELYAGVEAAWRRVKQGCSES